MKSHPFFLFLPCPAHPSPGNFVSRTSDLFLSSRDKATCKGWVCWTALDGAAPQEKSESGRGGWKTQGGKIGEKPLPKNVFGPPTYDTFSPPLFWRLSVISLKRKRHRPDQPQFLRPPKVVLESTLCSTFSPPQIHAIRFAPPSATAQKRRKILVFFFCAKKR